MNPYTNQTFFGFFGVLFKRLISGAFTWDTLATDEIQMLVLTAVAASSALIGSFLVLRKTTMLANSLSHTLLVGLVGAFFLTQAPMLPLDIRTLTVAALLMGLITTFLTEFLTKVIKLQEDASTGLIFTSLFALGVLLITLLTKNIHLGQDVVMGNVDGLTDADLLPSGLILLLDFSIIFLLFKEFKLTTFDPPFAQTLGFSPARYNYLLMILVALTVIGAFRAVGVIMVLTLITAPPLIARRLTKRLVPMIFSAVGIGAGVSLLGVALSRHLLTAYQLPLSTGGLVILLLTLVFFLTHLMPLRHSRSVV